MMLKVQQYLKLTSLLISIAMAGTACTSVSTGNGNGTGYFTENNDWLIPASEVYTGASRDQIQSIDNPEFAGNQDIGFMKEKDLIIALNIEGEIRGYPHKVMNYHEIVNDHFGNTPVAVTYCPLTGSAITWNRVVNVSDTTTFGVSGKIYKNNLIPYDRATESNWSQMIGQSVFGPLKERFPKKIYYSQTEMTWKVWKELYPQNKVLKGTVILSRAYDDYPYGEDYATDHKNIVFPIANEDDRLPRKEYVHGVNYNSDPVAFPLKLLKGENRVINYDYEGGKIVVAGDAEKGIVVSYSRLAGDKVTEFSPTTEALPALMEDEKGNVWDIYGKAVSGPDKGEELRELPSFNAYWFAWADFYPEIKIFGEE